MGAQRFIDTNVFVYHLNADDARKRAIADSLIRQGLADGSACISFQVVQECLNVVLRKAAVPLTPAQARSYMDAVLLPLTQVAPSATLYRHALELKQRWQFSFYDALIVAAALGAGCTELASEDLQHGQRIESLVVRNPFIG
mgnify:CR=1 FL=1